MIYVINSLGKPPEGIEIVNTTSRSTNWSKGLSPFFVGPIDLYGDYKSVNFENAWQFSKVYEYYLEEDGSIGERYFKWAQTGWNDTRAHRYPMGKGAKPLYSYWDNKTLHYIEARKEIYVPLYAKAVQKTSAFEMLKELYNNKKDLVLWDFDAHNLTPETFTYDDLWNNPSIKVGHAYVLAMLLEGVL